MIFLYIVVTYGAMMVAQSFSTLFRVLSGPFAIFGLTLLSSFFTPSSDISKWLISGDGLPFNSGLFVIHLFFICEKHTNCWFSASALLLLSSIIFLFELSVAIPHESLFFDFIYCQHFFPTTGVFLSPSSSTSNNCDI